MKVKYDVKHFEVRPNQKDILVLVSIKTLVDAEIKKGNVPEHLYKYRNQISYSTILRLILQDAVNRPETIEALFRIKGFNRQLRKTKKDFEQLKKQEIIKQTEK